MGMLDWLFGKKKPEYDNSTAWVEYRDNPARRGRKSAPHCAYLGLALGAPVGARRRRAMKVGGRAVRPNPYAPCDSDYAFGKVPAHLRKVSKYSSAKLNLTRGKHAGTMQVIGCGTGPSRTRKYGGRRDTTFAVQFLEADMSPDATRGIRYVPKSWFAGNARRIERIAKLAAEGKPLPKRRKARKASAKPARRSAAKRPGALPRGTRHIKGDLCLSPSKRFASCKQLKVARGAKAISSSMKRVAISAGGRSFDKAFKRMQGQYERAALAGDPLALVLQRRLRAMTSDRTTQRLPTRASQQFEAHTSRFGAGEPELSGRARGTADLQRRYDEAVRTGNPIQHVLRKHLMEARPNPSRRGYRGNPYYAVPRGHRF